MEKPIEGCGLGFRIQHFEQIMQERPPVPWFEVITEEVLQLSGQWFDKVLWLNDHYPLVLHGVGLSIGSTDPLNQEYLNNLKILIDRLNPAWVSDHLSWSSYSGYYVPDLMPLPFTKEAVSHCADRIKQVQDFLGCNIFVENVATHLFYQDNEYTEVEFNCEILCKAQCHLLLDVNNWYVCAHNRQHDPVNDLRQLPKQAVRQIHLAGYEQRDRYLYDNHSQAVHPPVWDLYRICCEIFGPVPALIEWDQDIPDLSVLLAQAAKAEQIMNNVCNFAREEQTVCD